MQNRVISVNLKKIRSMAYEQGISIRRLEIEAGLKNGTIRKWNKAVPNVKSLFGVAEVLGVEFNELTDIK